MQRITRGAALVLFLLPMCLTGRALLGGRVYAPIDLPFAAEPIHSLAAKFGITTYNPALSDVFAQMIPWQEAVRRSWSAGAWPLLNQSMLCGDVLAASYQPAPYDPFNVLGLLIPLPFALTYTAAMALFAAAFSMFVFARSLGLREEASIIGASAWMLSFPIAFFVEWPLTHAWAYLPLVLFGVRSIVRTPSAKSAGLLTLAFVLLILAGHPETVLHVVAIAATYGIFELTAVRANAGRAIAYASVSGVLALLLTAFALLPFLEAAPQTHDYAIRNGIWKQTTWPWMPEVVKRRVASSLLPMWGGQPWRGPVTADFDPNNWRVGSIAIVLAVLALVWARRRETWFFAALAVICAWAGANALPVARILHALPLFDVTLNERLAWAAAFALSLLAAIAVDSWPGERRLQIAGIAAAAVAAIALLAAMRNPLIAADVVPLAILALLLAFRTPARIALPAICALVLLQRVAVDGAIYPTLPARAFYPEPSLIRSIPRSPHEPYRAVGIGNAFTPNGMTMYGFEDARGYDAMTFERLYETYPLWSKPQTAFFNAVEDPRRPFLDFLNVRWLIGASTVTENRNAMPRAFVPQRIWFATSALEPMLDSSDFRTQAWIEVPQKHTIFFNNATGSVRTNEVANGLDLDAEMRGDGWVVVSQTAWKGWRTYVDGRRVQWRYANHAFIGIYVPSGRHRVTMRYLPESFTRGRGISLATLVAIAVGVLTRRAWDMRHAA